MKVCVFSSTREVIKAEQAVKIAGIKYRVIPVPRSVSPFCGMALELTPDVYDQALAAMKAASIKPQSLQKEFTDTFKDRT